jgi:ABC-type sulfate transport system permease component
MTSFIVILLAIAVAAWGLLEWRERRRAAGGQPRHGPLRLIFAATAILTVLFSGGCGLLFLYDWIRCGMPTNDYVSPGVIAFLSLPPVLVGIFIWWLAMRRKSS